MKLLSIGYNHLHDEKFIVDRPNGIDTWLFLIIKTPAIFLENGEMMVVTETSFVLYETDVPQRYGAYGQEYIDDWFHFLPSEEDIRFFHNLKIPMNQVTKMNNPTDITGTVRNMAFEFYSENTYKTETIDLHFKLLIYKISQMLCNTIRSASYMDSAYFVPMQALRNDIYNNPQIERTVDSMAAQLSISRSAFQHNYKLIFGKGVMSDVIESRLIRVKFYLSTTDMPLSQLAQLCGYHNEIHLIRQFKQRYGMTPTQFRKFI